MMKKVGKEKDRRKKQSVKIRAIVFPAKLGLSTASHRVCSSDSFLIFIGKLLFDLKFRFLLIEGRFFKAPLLF
jgi:hypothetical protein